MAETKLEKVKPAEYGEVKDPASDKTVKAIPEPEEVTESTDEWGVGKSAPSTKYLDKKTEKVVDTQPILGKVIVFKGDLITHNVHKQLEQYK